MILETIAGCIGAVIVGTVIILIPIVRTSNRANNRDLANAYIILERLYGVNVLTQHERLTSVSFSTPADHHRAGHHALGRVAHALPQGTPGRKAIGTGREAGDAWSAAPWDNDRTLGEPPAVPGRPAGPKRGQMGLLARAWDRFHFKKRVKVVPGWHINLSKKVFSRHPADGVSHTLGGKLASYNTRRKTWHSNPPGPGWLQGKRKR